MIVRFFIAALLIYGLDLNPWLLPIAAVLSVFDLFLSDRHRRTVEATARSVRKMEADTREALAIIRILNEEGIETNLAVRMIEGMIRDGATGSSSGDPR